MARVAVAGVGMTNFGKQEELSIEQLGAQAALEALEDSGIDPSRIDLVIGSNVLGGGGAGQRVLEQIGILGPEVVNVENACASGTTAVHLARRAISSGEANAVLVIGVEKMTGLFKGGITLDRTDRPTAIGLTMAAIYALWAQRYSYEYGVPVERLADISVKNRRYGAANPLAMFRQPVTAEEVLTSKPVADPLTLLQCCANSDGAAAAVLVSEQVVGGSSASMVRLLGTGVSSGREIGRKTDLSTLAVSQDSARKAFSLAGVKPQEIDLAEIHDAFTIGEVMATEAIGLASPGKALLEEVVPVNVSGGLLSKGHPVGATGVAQLVELTRHLRGEAGERQVPGARLGIAHTIGGGVSTLEAIASGTLIVGV